jgi:hypothetical protein
MKKISLLILFVLYCYFVYGQRNLTGIYINKWGDKIEIKRNRLNYKIADNLECPFFYNDTLAKCVFKWVDDNFIELNSTSPYVIACQGLKVIQSTDSIVTDSIQVSFSIPSQNHLKASITTNAFKTYNLNYSKNSRELMLPKGTKSISFSISPDAYFTPHSIDGLYYGVLLFSSIEYSIERKTNHINIEIPAIDDTFFERYYVKGDYAKISNDSITWKGIVFVKKE